MRRSCTEVEWFEDYRVGDEFAGEPVPLSEREIVDFARRYDPQPFHVDPAAAKESPYRGLIASGFHTAAAVWGGMLRAGFLNGRGIGAPGIEIQWLKPVRPGDTLTMAARVVEARTSRSKPDRGFVTFQSSVTNQNGEEVMTLSFTDMIRTRPR
jgi:acyl dehydratase